MANNKDKKIITWYLLDPEDGYVTSFTSLEDLKKEVKRMVEDDEITDGLLAVEYTNCKQIKISTVISICIN